MLRERSAPGHAVPAAPSDGESRDFAALVRDALAQLADLPYLQTHPLARGAGDAGGGTLARARTLQRDLSEAIAGLAPDPAVSARQRDHLVLHLRYVEGLGVAEVCDRLGISRAEYYRQHQRAFERLLSVLRDRWEVHPTLVPLRAASPPSGRGQPPELPRYLTSLLGRERDLAVARELLACNRLVTLLGAGGCGKTRLAIALAELVAGRFRDGVVFVDLAPVGESGLVLAAIARALGLREASAQPIPETVGTFLSSRQMLLILDNFEHVLAAAPAVVDLLGSAENVTVLVTSRAPLRVAGEQEIVIAPLELPDRMSHPSPTLIAQSPAVALFLERARAVSPSFELTTDNARAIADVCCHLDGVPLAIELAAPWVRVLPVEVLAARLGKSLDLLTSQGRSGPPRQHTLRATLEWSYSLLDAPARLLLQRLGAFVGSFGLAAAEAVGETPEEGSVSVVESLGRLVDASLVVCDPAPGRYRLHETIRLDARDRLAARGELDGVRRRHARYFRERALAALAALWDSHPDRDRWFAELDQDLDNVRAAWSFAEETGDVETSLWFGGAVAGYFNVRGLLIEARTRLAEALKRAGNQYPEARAWACLGAAALARSEEEPDEAVRHGAASVELFRQLGVAHGLAHALVILGTTHAWWGDAATARPLLEEALALGQTSQPGPGVGIPLLQLGLLALVEGDNRGAVALLEQGRSALQLSGDRFRASHALFALAFAALGDGRPDLARASLDDSLAIVVARRDVWGLAFVLEAFAGLLAPRDPRRALRLAGAAELVRERGDLHVSVRSLLRVRDRFLATARQALDPAAAAAAWAEGRETSTEEILEELQADCAIAAQGRMT